MWIKKDNPNKIEVSGENVICDSCAYIVILINIIIPPHVFNPCPSSDETALLCLKQWFIGPGKELHTLSSQDKLVPERQPMRQPPWRLFAFY